MDEEYVVVTEMLTNEDADDDANSLMDCIDDLDVLIDIDCTLESLAIIDEDIELLELAEFDDVLDTEEESLRQFVEELDALVEYIPDME